MQFSSLFSPPTLYIFLSPFPSHFPLPPFSSPSHFSPPQIWTEISHTHCRVHYIMQMDPKGWLPATVINFVASSNPQNIFRLSQYPCLVIILFEFLLILFPFLENLEVLIKSKIKNQKSKIKNQKLKIEIKNRKSKIENQKAKIENQKSKFFSRNSFI
jgi:hypothetical protein